MEYEQFSKIYQALKSVSADSSLNQGNAIEAIKNQLSQNLDAYKEWEKRNFSLDHVFTTVNNGVESKHTLLTAAFNREDSKVANFLIKKVGADVNAVGVDGLTPLIIAIEKECGDPKHKELVDLLMEANADVNVAGADEMTPISKAVERGNLRVFEALIAKGVNVDVKLPNGESLLEWAESHEQYVENKEDMKAIINILKAHSKEKGQKGAKSTGGQTPVNGGNANTQSTTDNTTPEKNETTFLSKHKAKIALSVGLCVAGAVAAYVLAYPAVTLALAVLAAVILMGAGIAKVCEKVKNPSVDKVFDKNEQLLNQ